MEQRWEGKVADRLEEFLSSYVKERHVPLRRENSKDFAARLMRRFALFTLPSLPDSLVINALKAKFLYGLWNTVIDDQIDQKHKGKSEIMDTINIIHAHSVGEKTSSNTTISNIMKDLLDLTSEFPETPNTSIAKEFLLLDLLRTASAFNYERIALAGKGMTTFAEYMEFSALTTDVRCMLDIDLTLIQEKLTSSTVGKLREVYGIFGVAFRIYNDISTLEREFSSEISLNSVILKGIEIGILPEEFLEFSPEEKRMYKEDVASLCKDMKRKIDQTKDLAISKIPKITQISVEPLKRGFELLTEETLICW